MGNYQCSVCGYIYDQEIGDADSGVKPGTVFIQLPGIWVCPVCGAGQEEFKQVESTRLKEV